MRKKSAALAIQVQNQSKNWEFSENFNAWEEKTKERNFDKAGDDLDLVETWSNNRSKSENQMHVTDKHNSHDDELIT